MMVDEGGMGIKSVYGTSFALAGVAEKGALVSARSFNWTRTFFI